MPILDTTDRGLGESLQLSVVGRADGTVACGTDETCRDNESALVYEGIGELVEEVVLVLTLGSSIACSLVAAEVCL